MHAVEQHKVLGGFPASDEDLPSTISHGYHARLGGKVVDEIPGNAGRGDQLDVLREHSLLACGHAGGAGFPFGLDDDFTYCGLLLGQCNVEVP